MKIKLDENLPTGLAALFQDAGHDVHTVKSEQLEGKPDPIVVAATRAEHRVLITLDKGIANPTSPDIQGHAGIVLLRLKHPSASAIMALIQSHLNIFASAWREGTIIVLSPGSVRIR